MEILLKVLNHFAPAVFIASVLQLGFNCFITVAPSCYAILYLTLNHGVVQQFQ